MTKGVEGKDKRAFYVMDDPVRPVNKEDLEKYHEDLKEFSEALKKYKGTRFTVSHVASIHMTWETDKKWGFNDLSLRQQEEINELHRSVRTKKQ